MGKPLRVLNVEDSTRDAALLTRHLATAGYELSHKRVDTPEAMQSALESDKWDVILCDYSMPQFSALAALKVLERSGLDIPLIIISGTVGEDVAVEAMRSGASDYLMKDNLARLGPTIERELKDAENRRAQRATLAALKESEAEMRALFQAMNDVILVLDSDGRHLKVAPTSPTKYYKQRVHRIGKTVQEIFPAEVADFILRNVRQSLDEARTMHIDYSLVIDGHDVWFDATVTPMTDDSVMWVAREVTERKRLEDERRIIFEIIQGSIETQDLDRFLKLVHHSIGQIVYAENCYVMLHDPVNDMISFEFWVDCRDPRPKPKRIGTGFASHVLRTGIPLRLTKEEKTRLLEQGEAEQIGSTSASWIGVPLRTPLRTIGVLVLQHYEKENAFSERDLEFLSSVGDQIALAIERKRAEDGLRESESLLAASQRITHLGSWVTNLSESDEGKRSNERWSDEHYRIFGFEPGHVEITDEVFYNSVHPDDRERHAATVRDAIEQRRPFDIEHRIILPDGSERIVHAMAELVINERTAKPVKLLGSVQDITERKRNEKVLRESQDRYRDLVENALDIIYTHDLEGNYTSVNKAAEKITGYSRDEVLAMNITDSVAPEALAKVRKMIAEKLDGNEVTAYNIEIAAKDGRRIPVEVNTRIIYENGVPVGVQGIARDITERKQADEAMRESEERFSGAFEYAPIGVALVAPDGRWLKVNRALCDLVGYTEAELLKSSFQEITYPDDLEADLANVKAMIAGEINSYQMEKRYIHKLGQIVSVLLNVSLVRDSDGQPRYFISQIQDMTERKELEDQFRQSQKMEAVGVLAGGIAHDFNNLLTAINGYSDLTLRKMSADDPLRHNIEEVKEAGNRAAELTGQLLAFSRKQVLRSEVISLNTVVTNIENMLRRIIRESVDLRVVLDPNLGNVKADPGQIEQVVMNLAINARDAMPDGGTLTIETQNVYLDEHYVSQHIEVSAGEFIKMTVTDTGHGMDAKTQLRMFEPFFTTKEIGKGTGLGLSTVYGIVKQSGGDIMVYSEVGHGTTFKIYLPCVDEAVEQPKWSGERQDKYLGTETILLVEDEEVVRKLVNEVLSASGYKILEAASGTEALSICETYSDPIDLLLTDVIMPKMGGAELRDHMVKLRPEIKILFMSGYTDDAVSHRGVLDAKVDFIEKPFTPDGLARKVREVLAN